MTGQTILHYKILRKIGGGGMGVVYEAEDTKLGRRVALKFLPEQTSQDAPAMERFLREARAASSLNHPGICTVYAIEDNAGRTFIAMELLEGESLDKTLAAGAIPLPRIIDMGIQMADALDAAHKKGIVHRDIKPGNLMVSERGTIKILDFGLAKLLDPEHETLSGTTLTEVQTTFLTSPGTSVGTIAYMSPEQARGEELDGRSDLFSLGAVLYQMVTGKNPFPGATSAVIFDGILHKTPVAPASLNPTTPAELERIIDKALEKDRDTRYQVASELRADLKRLQRESESGRVVAAAPSSARVAANSAAPSPASAVSPEPKPASSSSVIIEAVGKYKLRSAITLALVFVVLLAAAYGIYSLVLRNQHPPFEKFSIENLTNNGHVSVAAISPDGKYLLHAREENGLQSLWLRHIPTGSNTQVIAPAATHYDGLTFSPDGNFIYFVRRDEDEHTISILYRAPVLGGSPVELIRDVDSPVTFSPDGQRLAFLREKHDSPFYDLLIANGDGSGEHALFSNKQLLTDSSSVAWSPDGKLLAIPIVQPTKDYLGGMLIVDSTTAKESLVGMSPGSTFHAPVWMPNGSALVFPMVDLTGGSIHAQLGLLPYPKGEIRVLTSDTNNYVSPSVAVDGKTLVATQSQSQRELSVTSASAPSEWHPIRLPTESQIWLWDWTPDGRLIIPQAGDVYLLPPGGEAATIYADKVHLAVQVASCDNGRMVVYRQLGRSGSAHPNLWRMNVSGTNLKQLTFGQNESEPQCGPDPNWVYFIDIADNRYVKRVAIEGGAPETMVKTPVSEFGISPNGKKIISIEVREEDHKLVARIDSTDDHKTMFIPIDQRASQYARFTPDGKGILFVTREKGVDNLWTQSLDGGSAKQLTHFTADFIYQFAYSRDGSKLAIERGHIISDAVLLRDTSSN